MALQGTIKDFGLADILQLIGIQRKTGVLNITDPAMTRFNITLREGVDMVLWAIGATRGGEIFVPKIPSYRITDVAEAIGPKCTRKVVGIRPGEKIHEEMITASDSYYTVDLGAYYAILSSSGADTVESYAAQCGGSPVAPGFSYNSGTNDRFLGVEEICALVREHVDASHTT